MLHKMAEKEGARGSGYGVLPIPGKMGRRRQQQITILCFLYFYQSWALAHFFEVRYPLLTQFFPLDR
jgi:hypothetical protein